MKVLMALLVLSLLSAAAVIAESDKTAHTEYTDRNGTGIKTESSDTKSTNIFGTKKSEHDSKIIEDPKGLGNKTTITSHREAKLEKDGDASIKTNTVDATGTGRETKTTTSTSKHLIGDGTTTKITQSGTVDPKGLGNKQTASTEVQVDRNAEGEVEKRTVTKKIDGTTVSEETSEVR